MKRVAFVDQDGVVCHIASVDDGLLNAFVEANTHNGHEPIIDVSEDIKPGHVRRSDGTFGERQPTLEELKVAARVMVDQTRQTLNYADITLDGLTFQANAVSQANIRDYVIQAQSGIPLPEGFTWRDRSNVNRPVTAEFLTALNVAITQRRAALYQHSWDLKAAIDKASTLEAFKAIDLTSGWQNSQS